MKPGQFHLLLVISAVIAAVTLTVAALLVQLGCRLVRAEVPSFGKALWVNVLAMGSVFIVNLSVGAIITLIVNLSVSAADAATVTNIALWILQAPIALCLPALIYRKFFNKVSFGKGLVISLIMGIWIAVAMNLIAPWALARFLHPERLDPDLSLRRASRSVVS